ncbi:LysE family translocator [Porphyromonas sp.]|uniref:LysE family translocator n=1 Tax=Porphyromonas sp. TaxID=1924944 RepID=UPI0026DD83CB|nr:LysE family transporter [Porphyromonas sp.]MDO4695853.1 LysE family transporter [Porphyromonas sp.]MDO4770266.1 LysE family transporter [Porphyromonas sp.]
MLLETLLKGILIGIIVSAPMGPIGMLCVRRTMARGKRYGLLTGLGATVSDLIYAFLTLLGVGAFIDFIIKYTDHLQLAGSIFMILFAIYVFFGNHSLEPPTRKGKNKEKKNGGIFYSDEKKSDFQVFLSAFLLTFGNILIVLLYIGLFAQFSFVSEGATYQSLLLGLVGIGIGAILWWYIVTTILIKVKQWFNVTSLLYFNRGIGSIIFFLGIYGIIAALSGLLP